MTLQDTRHLLLEIVALEGREETEGAQIEGHHRWHRLLKQLGGIQQSPIASQADDEVNPIGQVIAAISAKGETYI